MKAYPSYHTIRNPRRAGDLQRSAVALLALVLLVPALTGIAASDHLQEGPGTGSAPSCSRTRSSVHNQTLFNNSKSDLEINFNSSGGSALPYLTLPADCWITNATLDVGFHPLTNHSAPTLIMNCSTASGNMTVYNASYMNASGQALNDLKKYHLSPKDMQNLSAIDNKRSVVNGSSDEACELYGFRLSNRNVSAMTFSWYGYDAGSAFGGQINLSAYNYTNSSWDRVNTGAIPGILTDTYLNGTLEQPWYHLGADNIIWFLIVDSVYYGGSGPVSVIRTNYIQLNLTLNETGTAPRNVSVDIGDDGVAEFSRAANFTGVVEFNATGGLVELLRGMVNASNSSTVMVPINITCGSSALVRLSHLRVDYRTDLSPVQEFTINDVMIFEDAPESWVDILDLSSYFSDPDGGTLYYTVSYTGDPGNITLWVPENSSLVQANVTANHYGTCQFRVRAWDTGADGIKGNNDDLWVGSNNISLEVFPVNDRPVIHDLGGIVAVNSTINLTGIIDAVEDTTLSLNVNSSDVDGPSLSVSLLNAPTSMTVVGSNITWTPTNADVGTVEFVINVSDGDIANERWDLVKVILNVLNTPDAPVLHITQIPKAYEDQPWSLAITATDIDPGDNLTIDYNLTDATGDVDIPSMSLVGNGSSASLSFTPTQEDVGWFFINISVHDSYGLEDTRMIPLEVLNTNDAPRGVLVSPLDGETFLQGTAVELNISVYDDDTPYGDIVTVTWSSNISGILGTGPILSLTDLSVGEQNISVELDDGDVSVTYSVNITILALNNSGGNGSQTNDTGEDPSNGTHGQGNNTNTGNTTDGGGNDDGSNSGIVTMAIVIGVILLLFVVLVIGIAVVSRRKKAEADDTREELNRERDEEARKKIEEEFGEIDPDAIEKAMNSAPAPELDSSEQTFMDTPRVVMDEPMDMMAEPDSPVFEPEKGSEPEKSDLESTLDDIFSFDSDPSPRPEHGSDTGSSEMDWASIGEELDEE